MPVIELEALVAVLNESRLLTERQLADLRAEIDASAEKLSGQQLVARLVEREVLTRWQARMLLSGRKAFFLGRYKLLKELGRGGMGAVFQAEHATLKRIVALKVMASQLLQDERAIARFHREIQAAAALDHPNIVAAYDAESVEETHFLVMEYVPGQTLEDLVEGEKTLPIATACEYIRQAALGLAHAHDRGMAHRDIKPANLLVSSTADGGALVKILDMGLARFASESGDDGGLTKTGQIMGTPDFIAPEQARNTKVADIRSDIFSLGCTLFRLLTGRVPYGGENVMEKLMARALEDAPRVRSKNPEVPDELDTVVAKMLARDPDSRYQTPGELVAALDAWAVTSRRGALVRVAAPVVGKSIDDDSQEYILEAIDSELDSFLRHLSTEAAEGAETGRSTGQLSRLAHAVPTISEPSPERNGPGARIGRKSRQPGAVGQRKTYIGLGLAAASIAMAVGLSIWHRRQQTILVLDWPNADRIDAALMLDGSSRQLSAQDELVFPGRPGKRVLKLERAGYEPFEAELQLSGGEKRVVRPEWKLTALSRRKRALADLKRESVELLKGMTSVPESIDPGTLALNRRLVEFSQRWRGSKEGNEAQRLLRRLPAPLDLLRRTQISQDELRAAGQGNSAEAPGSLVAVYGNRQFKHWAPVTAVAVSADNKTLYSLGRDGTIRLWNRDTGDEVRIITGIHHEASDMAISSDGKLLVTSEFFSVRLWDLTGDKEPRELTGHRELVTAVTCDSQTHVVASASRDRTVKLWDADTGVEFRSMQHHSADVLAVALSPDGDSGASAGRDGFVRVWSRKTGEERFALPFSDHLAYSVAFSHDGKKLAAGGETRDTHFVLKQWDVETGKLLFDRQPGTPAKLQFSPDDRYIVGTNPDLSASLVDAETGAAVQNFRLGTLPGKPAFADQGRTLITCGSDGTIVSWNVETGGIVPSRQPEDHPRAVVKVRLSQDGTKLISVGSDGSVMGRDLTSSKLFGSIEGTKADIRWADVTPDGGTVAVGGSGVHVWDLGTASLKFLESVQSDHKGFRRVAFTSDGKMLAIGAQVPAMLRIVDLEKSEVTVTVPPHEAAVDTLEISPDGSLVVTGLQDGKVHVWSAKTGEKIRTLTIPGSVALPVAFSPDGGTLATLEEHYVLRLWNTKSWSEVRRFQDANVLYNVVSMAFHPDGQILACAGRNGSVSLLETDVMTLKEKLQIGPAGGITWDVAFSPEGRHLVTANNNGTVYVLRLAEWSPESSSAGQEGR